MTCPSELTCSRYVDGAISSAEASELGQHLESCLHCSLLVEQLTAEREVLRLSMQTATADGVIPAFVPRPTISRLLVWLGWISLSIWALSTSWMTLASTLSLPGWISWLSPDALGTGIALFVGMLLNFTGDGSIFGQVLPAVRSAALATLALFAFGWLIRHQPGRAASMGLSLSLIGALFAVAPQSQAIEIRRDDDRVVIQAGEVIDDTLIILSEDVIIDGEVTGDVIALGESVSIRGRIGGLLFAAGETVNLEGSVTGSAFGVGETVSVRSTDLKANLFGVGETVIIYPDSQIGGNGVVVAEDAEVAGQIGKDLIGVGDGVKLLGSVGGNMRAMSRSLRLAAGASIGGDLNARLRSTEDALIDDGASIGGERNLTEWPKERSRYLRFEFYAGEIIGLLAAFITGLVLFRLIPGLASVTLESGAAALTTAGIGAVALIATPALAMATLITLIGAPIAILALLIWGACLYFAAIVTAKFIGTLILPAHEDRPTLPLLLGLSLLVILGNLPLIGGPIELVVLIIGLGMIVQWVRQNWVRKTAD